MGATTTITGTVGTTPPGSVNPLEHGGAYMVYQSVASLTLGLRRTSVRYVRPACAGAWRAGLPVGSAVLGGWGVPWGPVAAVGALVSQAGPRLAWPRAPGRASAAN